jgi:polyhydroxyalkanoate synthesis regulator phasin
MNLLDIKNKLLNNAEASTEAQQLQLTIKEIKSSIFTAVAQQVLELNEQIQGLEKRITNLEKRER